MASLAAITTFAILLIVVTQAGFTSSFCSVKGWLCCRWPFLSDPDTAYQTLADNLQNNVFGQHIAVDAVLKMIRSHTAQSNPSKALALSFHGWTGSGKTFVAEQIVSSIYGGWTDQNFVRFYRGGHDFGPDVRPEVIQGYKKRLREEIRSTVGSCDRAVFIFDEAHKIAKSVLDALAPFLEPGGRNFEGLNYRRSIFILLSNTGASEINDVTFDSWKASKPRGSLTFHDFEKQLQIEAFNSDEEAPGFLDCALLKNNLIDLFVPFLPMEKEHVRACAEVEIKRVGASVSPEFIADKLLYWPDVEGTYSTSGCKRIHGLIKKYHSELTRKQGSEEF